MSGGHPSETTRWWWIRHAPVVDHGGRLYGQSDVACDLSDGAAVRTLAATLPASPVWVRSPLKRAAATAAALIAARGSPVEPAVEPALVEQNFGAWQQRTWAEIRAAYPDLHRAFWRDPAGNAPPGGESFAELIARVSAAVLRLTAGHAGRDIVAVAHGGTVRAALALALAIEPARALGIEVDNLSLTRLDHSPGRIEAGHKGAWRVVTVNRTADWISPAPV